MSFILEALKKSENKHRRNGRQNPRSIHEPMPRNKARSRFWVLGILLLLTVNAVFLLWFFAPWQKSPARQSTDVLSTDTQLMKTTSPPPQAIVPAEQSHVVPKPVRTEEKPAVQALPVPRNDKQVYSFGQLPVSIQKKIPPLQMSLHAYNRADGSASLVQLNDRIMREGDAITDNILLQKITADGAVLRYDGYLFLLPRRGN